MMSNTHRTRAARLNVAVTREAFVPNAIQDVFDFVAAEDVLPSTAAADPSYGDALRVTAG